MKKISDSWGIGLISLVICFIVFLFSSSAIWLGDDILYRYHIGTGEEISSVWDCFTSQLEHYKVMNGRFVAHFLVQISIALLGQTWFSLFNSFIYILCLILLIKLIGISFSEHLKILFLSLLILFGFQTKFVPSCQIGYIWMFAIVLIYILLFFKSQARCSGWHLIWLIPFSVIAGWTQEAVVVGISVALIVYVFSHWKTITFNQWVMFFSFGFGAMLLCFSPGTLSRTSEIHGGLDFLPPFTYSLLKMFFYLRVTYIFIFYVIYLLFIRKVSFKELYSQGSFFIIALLALLVFNVVLGVFGNRQLFGIELMSLILLMKYLNVYSIDNKILITLIFVLCCYLSYSGIRNLSLLRCEHKVYNQLVEEYDKSDDGRVYYDFSAKEVTFYETYPSDVFTPYVLTTISRYLNSNKHSLKHFVVLPTCCNNLETGSYYISKAQGSYCAVIDKKAEPDKIVQKRAIVVGPITVPFKDREITNLAPVYETDESKVLQIYDKVPFINTTSIDFIVLGQNER